ncbi:hypothetical protein DOTSEDRAFT_163739 [Lecanosticta acicola]|uniref:Luciferase domain-containing protein n=1 Tax=Lecanosticta acicola TaxID=111012 RepID=A0AAI8YUM4_9PEZI|nr:hypothetical protein DOTSEDRAFT_163739 [Lecanosticta acicola]
MNVLATGIISQAATSLFARMFACLLITAAVLPVAFSIRKDYQDFLSLGPGGTPQTFRGYLRIKFLGLFALKDPYAAAISTPAELKCARGCLKELPKRQWPRPRTRGIAPHRQVEQRASKQVFYNLAERIKSLAPGKEYDLVIGTSCFEKHGTGLFSTCPANQTCRGEVIHVHPSDGSMHMTLHPADANMVLECGWGERHPLAGVFYDQFLPRGFIMLYAPQNDEEVEVVLRVIRAACWFVCDDNQKGRWSLAGDGALIEETAECGAGADGRGNVHQVEDPSRALEKIITKSREAIPLAV